MTFKGILHGLPGVVVMLNPPFQLDKDEPSTLKQSGLLASSDPEEDDDADKA